MSTASSDGLRRYYDINGWLFVGPAVALIAIFMIYPIGQSLWINGLPSSLMDAVALFLDRAAWERSIDHQLPCRAATSLSVVAPPMRGDPFRGLAASLNRVFVRPVVTASLSG